MATDNKSLEISLPVNADLSASQYKVVELNTSGKLIDITAITRIPIGILQNKPDTANKPGAVMPLGGGVSKIRLGATLTAGALVGVSAAGKAVADATTNYTLGILLEGGDDDDIGSVLLTPLTAKA